MRVKILFIIILLIVLVMSFFDKVKYGIRYVTAGNVTDNFKWAEFDSKDGFSVPEEYKSNIKSLSNNLEVIREHFNNSPVIIVSGYRTYAHNKKIGGATNSQHLIGKAVDIRIKGYTIRQVYEGILYLMNNGKIKKGGLAFSEGMNFVHYDIRGYFATWKYSR